MRALILGLLAFFVRIALSYSLTEATIKIGDESVTLGEFNTQEIKQLPINNVRDSISVSLKFDSLKKVPSQLVVTLGDNKGLVTTYVPSIKENSAAISIPVKKFPDVLKVQDKLFLNLIVSSPETDANIFKTLTEVIPSPIFKESSNYQVKKSIIGKKPEIHHIFNSDPSTINATIPLAFIAGSIGLFVILLGTWASIACSSVTEGLKGLSGKNGLYTVGFLSSIVGIEFNFVRYYLGQSIFSTLFNVSILALPTIYFGSKVLRKLFEDRKIGKA